MSYQTDDGLHEGWEAAEFPDGRFSVGPGDGGVLVRFLRPDLDTDAEPGVLDGRTAVAGAVCAPAAGAGSCGSG